VKKLFVVGLFTAGTLVLVAPPAAFAAEGPLPGGRPPCSVLHTTATGIDGPLCTHPAPGT
jgi:hypothetical protein